MHAGLAGLRSVSPPGHLQAVGRRSRAARQPRGGSATSGVPAAQPVRSRGAFCDEQSSAEPSWTAPGHPPRRLATGGRSAADGKRCSAARRADRDNSSVHRRGARCGAGPPRECGAAAGIGGGCEQVRGSCAPRPRLMRRAVRRRGTHQVPAAAPKWRPASPARLRAQRAIRRGAARCSGRRAARSAVRGHTKCRLRRRSGDRRARPTSAGMGAIRQGAGRELRRRSSGGRARSSAADAGAIQQCRGRRLRRRSSGGRARWSAACAGAIQQCRGCRLQRRSSGWRARWNATCAGAIQQCRGRQLRRRSSGVRARWNGASAGAVQECGGR